MRVVELNEQVLRLLRCPRERVIVLGATHFFEEPAPWWRRSPERRIGSPGT